MPALTDSFVLHSSSSPLFLPSDMELAPSSAGFINSALAATQVSHSGLGEQRLVGCACFMQHDWQLSRVLGLSAPVCLLQGVTVVLENMASVGNIVGGRLWHLRYIIDRVEDKSRIGFCIDTCHLFSSGGAQPSCAVSISPLFDRCHPLCLAGRRRVELATGMDLRTDKACQATFQEIDEVVGLKYLKVSHSSAARSFPASGPHEPYCPFQTQMLAGHAHQRLKDAL